MDLLEAILLGVIQGLTEFLPISSSGHLVITQTLMGMAEPNLLFDVVLHVGTLAAVVAFYRKDVWSVVDGLWRGARGLGRERSLEAFFEPTGARLAFLVVLATIPTGIIGLFLKDVIDPESGPRIIDAQVVFGLLIVNGFILFANKFFVGDDETDDKKRKSLTTLWNITPMVAVLIGIAQGIAVTPGFSRSGLTITAALALGVWRVEAARFSFLLSIPAILGALVLQLADVAAVEAAAGSLGIFLGGATIAALVGYLAILMLVAVLKRAQFHHFAWYCWLVGVGGLVFLLS